MDTTKATTIETTPVESHSTGFDAWNTLVLIKDGSYAIIIFLVIVSWLSRNAVSRFFEKHIALMESLTESNALNATINKNISDRLDKLYISYQAVIRLLKEREQRELDDHEDN